MTNQIKIEIVSDVSCPWCVIGYQSLQNAIEDLNITELIQLDWLPFELNPGMPSQGQNINEHLQQKYGSTVEQNRANRENIEKRALDVGYQFNFSDDGRIYNTFDAHRLLFWAKEHALQTELKLALFDLYFKQQGNPSDFKSLLNCVDNVGLDTGIAKTILDSEQFSNEINVEMRQSQQAGIHAVPAFIFNNKYLINGGQPKEVFADLLQKLLAD